MLACPLVIECFAQWAWPGTNCMQASFQRLSRHWGKISRCLTRPRVFVGARKVLRVGLAPHPSDGRSCEPSLHFLKSGQIFSRSFLGL